MARSKEPYRRIPAARVAAFIEKYIDENIETDEINRGLTQFSFEAGIPPRTIYGILRGERVNVMFDLLDEILVRLDRSYLWHWSPDEGGFSDYYTDEPGPAAEPTVDQSRSLAIAAAKIQSRRRGWDWQAILHEQAREEMATA